MAEYKKRTELCIIAAKEALAAFETKWGAIKPPVPVEELAESLGFKIVYLTTVPDEFSAIVSTRDKLIGINGLHHRHRQRFSLCHELAHILMNHPPESACTSQQISLYNFEADECAAELLIPTNLLGEYLRHTKGVTKLARLFHVSEEAMTRKLRQFEHPLGIR